MTDDDLRREVIEQRERQGLPAEPTDEQLAFVGAVIAADRRRQRQSSTQK